MYETVINSVKKFKKNIEIKKITPEWLDNYKENLIKDKKSISTVSVYLRQIRAVVNYAISKKYLSADKYPFANFEVPTSEPNKRALNDNEIKTLIYYKTESEQEQRAIDFWLFSYLGNGINFKDIALLKYSNIKGDYINFIREKTKNKRRIITEIKIYLLPEMKKIVKQYGNKKNNENDFVFPIVNSKMNPRVQYNEIAQFIKTTNKYLKRISSDLKFDFDCTTYYARHSFATKQKRSGVSIEHISESLGHSSITTTENYLKRFPDEDIKVNASKLLDL